MMDTFLDPFTDFGFRKLFADERNAVLLIDLLNALLRPQRQIVALEYSAAGAFDTAEQETKSIFDVHAKNEQGNVFIVQVQRLRERFFKDRSIFYSTFP